MLFWRNGNRYGAKSADGLRNKAGNVAAFLSMAQEDKREITEFRTGQGLKLNIGNQVLS